MEMRIMKRDEKSFHEQSLEQSLYDQVVMNNNLAQIIYAGSGSYLCIMVERSVLW
jgi:hypothetical protein